MNIIEPEAFYDYDSEKMIAVPPELFSGIVWEFLNMGKTFSGICATLIQDILE